MLIKARIQSLWQNLVHRDQADQELDEEVRSYLEQLVMKKIAEGMTPEEAQRSARISFGGVEQVKEEVRAVRAGRFLEDFGRDVRYGLRQLRRNPGFTAVAVLTLALGIGANTAIFTLVDRIMLAQLPVMEPGELYRVGTNSNCCDIGSDQGNWGIYSYPLYEQLRDNTPEFSQMAAFQAGLENLSVRQSGARALPASYVGEFVSGNYFAMFGLRPVIGRLISPVDDQPNAPAIAVMSYHTWRYHFAIDPSVIGETFIINTVSFTIAGVAPRGFFGDTLRPDPPDLWLPLSTEPKIHGQVSLLNSPGDNWLYIIGRLRPGAKPASVQSELTVKLQRWLNAHPGLPAFEPSKLIHQHIDVAPASSGVPGVQEGVRTLLRLLMLITGLVLLIACANIANLLLARGAARRAEAAIRTALGAPRRRLIRQMLTESVLLAALGGAAGIYIAYIGARSILALAYRGSHYIPISADPSWLVLGFAIGLSLVTGLIFGLAPAWIASRCHPTESLHGAGRSTQDRSSLLRRSLVVLQVATSLALLTGAGLLIQSLRNLENQRFGFETEGRWIVRVNPALAGYKVSQLYGLYQQLQPRLMQIPGVLSAAYSQCSPLEGENWEDYIYIEGQSPSERITASFLRVSPGYFSTIGTRLLRGRAIGPRDTATSPAVAVVNEAFVRKYLHGKNPIGTHFGLDKAANANNYEIVGVVEDAKYRNAREAPYPTFFLPFLQHPKGEPSWAVGSQYMGDIELRVAGRPQNLNTEVRRALAGINPNLTVLDMKTLGEQVRDYFAPEQTMTWLTEAFGGLALILACIGVYGVMSYSVARRRNEIGLRMALGASRGTILSMVLRGAFAQVIFGVIIGIPLAIAGGRLLSSKLYGVSSTDPIIMLAAAAILAACALLAAYMPARRAARVDPMVALRYE